MSSSFCVLMSVYYRDNADFLDKALRSLFTQTVCPNQIVLVKDGPLSDELENIINAYKAEFSSIIEIVSLVENVGLGLALNEGLKHCSYELVARMDADDICKPTRFEKQLAIFESEESVAVVGSWIDEFIDNPQNIISVRKLPERNEDLIKYFKFRSPLNHPTVMFKKSAIQEVGGYKHFYLLEDYYLWGRLIARNYELYNIQESLLFFRANSKMMARRGGVKYAKSEMYLFNEFRRLGLISRLDLIKNIVVRSSVRLIPNYFREIIYKNILRK